MPLRHHSERVKGKNYRLFSGKPLYRYIVESLLACPLITEVAINTDSEVIRRDVREQFPRVHLIERPPSLCGGDIPMNDILLYDVEQCRADFYVQTHSTNPLLRTDTITTALRTFLENFPHYDSLFSVTRMQTRLWNDQGQPLNHDPAVLLRTQDLPPIFEENSNLYIFTAESLQARKNRLGERPLMFEIPAEEAWDIDEELDFQIAEFLYNHRQSQENR